MVIPLAILIAVLGIFSRSVRGFVGSFVFWPCVVVLLITLYGMTA